MQLTGQADGDLIVDDNVVGATAPTGTPLNLIGPGTTAAVTADTLTTDGFVPLLPNGVVGLRLNPDTTQTETFQIATNTASTMTVVTPNEHGVAFASVAGVGARYRGVWRFDNLQFRRGGQLEVGDQLEVTDTLALVENGLLTHPQTTTTYEATLDLNVGMLTIDTSSRIDVTGRGYMGGRTFEEAGRTLGNAFGAGRHNGGSYGGLGGHDPSVAEQPNLVYGSVTDPRDLGSGGGAHNDVDGGDGGGRVLIVADTIANDGVIRANGDLASASRAGMGSGGTVNLTVRRLEGAGSIAANGGTKNGADNVGGGGGRIAIRYSEVLALPLANVQALGGDGFYADGGHGTVFVKATSQAFGDLVVDGFGHAQPADTTTIPGGITFNNIMLRNAAQAVSDSGVTVAGTLSLSGGAMLTHSAESEFGLRITAAQVVVEAGSAIDVTGRGYRGGRSFEEAGRTLGDVTGAGQHNGGSYGGLGAHAASVSEQPGLVYGDPKRPDRLGSGGGAHNDVDGGDGGGYVRIVASSAVVVDGAVRADGGIAGASQAGMGSGGSIWITTSRLAGTGTITANGGTKNGADNTGGGGGRIALYADFVDATANLNGLRNITAVRGRGFYDSPAGSAGTVFMQLTGQADGDLIVDDNVVGATAPTGTPLNLIGPGTTAAVTADTLTTDGFVPLLPNGVVGLRLNPDTTQTETFQIATNTASTMTVVTPNEHGVAFASVAGVGARYRGVWRFDNLQFRRGGQLEVGDQLEVTDTLALVENGLLTHPQTTTTYEATLDLNVGMLTIDTSSRIDVTGRGYMGGRTFEEAGRTLGNAFGAGRHNGGSYGGLGGHDPSVAEQPNLVYGSVTDPRDLGSGGGAHNDVDGGDGGGRILIVADTIANDGVIRANGDLASASRAGMGSGGTVNLTVRRLEGAGSIAANGGTKNGADNVGGGGGRIAIRYSEVLALPLANVQALGGDGFYADGQNGTVFTQGP